MRLDPALRFQASLETTDDGCILWTGSTDNQGYGQFSIGQRSLKVHRFWYEHEVEPIPDGMEIDHLCHDPEMCQLGKDCPHRRCVNPAHLQPVTPAENRARAGRRPAVVKPPKPAGPGRGSVNRDKTHCRYGHEFTPESTYINIGTGARACRICRRRPRVK